MIVVVLPLGGDEPVTLQLCDQCAARLIGVIEHVDQLDLVDDGIALAGTTRQRITAFLASRPGGAPPGKIAQGIGAKPHTVRARLSAMARARIVTVDGGVYTMTDTSDRQGSLL